MRTQESSPRTAANAHRSIGTLWTLIRSESVARCVLIKLQDGLELRVLMDDARLRSERCETHSESFELASRWRERMMSRGWVLPARRPPT